MWFSKSRKYIFFAAFFLGALIYACTVERQPLSDELVAKFQPGTLPFRITEETFYEFGEWEWHDSTVITRNFPDLGDADLVLLGEEVQPMPEGMNRRTAALKKFGPVDGLRVLLYRHDIRPVEDVPAAPEGSLKFVAVLIDEKNRVLDRKVIADWRGRYSLKLGSIDEHFEIRTLTRPYDSDQPDTLNREEKFKMTGNGWLLQP